MCVDDVITIMFHSSMQINFLHCLGLYIFCCCIFVVGVTLIVFDSIENTFQQVLLVFIVRNFVHLRVVKRLDGMQYLCHIYDEI